MAVKGKLGFDELHFGVTVILKKPTFWEWLFGTKGQVKFVLVYEVDGPTSVVALEGAETVLVEGPHDDTT